MPSPFHNFFSTRDSQVKHLSLSLVCIIFLACDKYEIWWWNRQVFSYLLTCSIQILFLSFRKVEIVTIKDSIILDEHAAKFFHYGQSGCEATSYEAEQIHHVRHNFVLEGVAILSHIHIIDKAPNKYLENQGDQQQTGQSRCVLC